MPLQGGAGLPAHMHILLLELENLSDYSLFPACVWISNATPYTELDIHRREIFRLCNPCFGHVIFTTVIPSVLVARNFASLALSNAPKSGPLLRDNERLHLLILACLCCPDVDCRSFLLYLAFPYLFWNRQFWLGIVSLP